MNIHTKTTLQELDLEARYLLDKMRSTLISNVTSLRHSADILNEILPAIKRRINPTFAQQNFDWVLPYCTCDKDKTVSEVCVIHAPIENFNIPQSRVYVSNDIRRT